ncbi:MAG: hypothetical protein WDO56_30650 [Gammaproteobacteria bacterium]
MDSSTVEQNREAAASPDAGLNVRCRAGRRAAAMDTDSLTLKGDVQYGPARVTVGDTRCSMQGR